MDLPGSSGSKQARSCIIPYGKALLLTPIDVECSFAENPTLKTETDLRSCAKSDQDQVNSLKMVYLFQMLASTELLLRYSI